MINARSCIGACILWVSQLGKKLYTYVLRAGKQVKIAEKVSALRVISADPTGPVFENTSLHMKTFTIKFDLDFV